MRASALALLVVLTTAVSTAGAEVQQTTGSDSWCSPAQNGSNNQVTCNGMDPRTLGRLNELLDLKDLTLQQKTAEANEWARKYNELNAQFEETKKQLAAKGEDPTLVQTAQDLLHQGKLDEARKIYDRLIASDEGNVDRAAQDYFDRASILQLQFRMAEAMVDYAKAYRYRPDNPRYAYGYGSAAYRERRYADAEEAWTASLQLYRKLAQIEDHRPDVARTLVTLGVVYGDIGRFADAQQASMEALEIYRALLRDGTGDYRPEIAMLENNLGVLYNNFDGRSAAQRLKVFNYVVKPSRDACCPDAMRATIKTDRSEAEKLEIDALGTYRDLSQRDPNTYRTDVAMTLNNLGVLYRDMDRHVDAEGSLTEAVTIYRELTSSGSVTDRSGLAMTLNNLGNLYRDQRQSTEAERVYAEAVTIYRGLVELNPDAYLPNLAMALNNFGNLCRDTRQLAEAERDFGEALKIYQGLAERYPSAYQIDLVRATENMTNFNYEMSQERIFDAGREGSISGQASKIPGEIAPNNH